MVRTRFEQPVEQVLRERMLSDQGMSQEGFPRRYTVATGGRLRGEPLVRRDVLHQPEQFGCDTRLWQRRRPSVPDPCEVEGGWGPWLTSLSGWRPDGEPARPGPRNRWPAGGDGLPCSLSYRVKISVLG